MRSHEGLFVTLYFDRIKRNRRKIVSAFAAVLLTSAGASYLWITSYVDPDGAPIDLDPMPINADTNQPPDERDQIAGEWTELFAAVRRDIPLFFELGDGFREIRRDLIIEGKQSLDLEERRELETHLARHSKLLDAIENQIREGGPLRPDMSISRAAAFDEDFYSSISRCGELLFFAATKAILSEPPHERDSIRYTKLLLDLASLVGREQLMTSYSVHCSFYRLASTALQLHCSRLVLSPSDGDGLIQRIVADRDPTQFQNAMKSDQTLMLLEFRNWEIRKGEPWWTNRSLGSIQEKVIQSSVGPYFMSIDRDYYLSEIDNPIFVSARSYASDAEEFTVLQREIADRVSLAGLGRAALQTHLNALVARWRHIAVTNMIETGICAEAFERSHGRYPSSLAELDEFSDTEMPLDPFTNERFMFESRDGSYSLRTFGAGLYPDGATQDPVIEWSVIGRNK